MNRSLPRRALGVLLFISSAVAAGPAAPAAAQIPGGPFRPVRDQGAVTAPPPQEALDPSQHQPVAAFTWRAQDRFASGWDSYVEGDGTYDPSYAEPRYTILLDGCASHGAGLPLGAHRWQVAAPDGERVPVSGAGCRARFTTSVEGDHHVTLTVGNGAGTDSSSGVVTVRDHLIAVLGDSMASGEGNDDDMVDPAAPPLVRTWTDHRCHRSRRSGLTAAAEHLEARNDRSSVTFVNLACSGAQVDSGVLGPYEGQEPASPALPSQVDALLAWVCRGGDPCPDDARHVEAIFLSVGVNDLGFSTIIKDCADPTAARCSTNRHLLGGIEDGLVDVADGLTELRQRLTGPLADAEVYLMQYPDDPFDSVEGGTGCGLLAAVDDEESDWVHAVGRRLNTTLRHHALRHGFTLVDGVASAFSGHGYCDADTWFVGITESLADQGNEDGALHPNPAGHGVIRDRIIAAYDAPKVERHLVGTATVTFEEYTVIDDAAVGPNGEYPTQITNTMVLRAATAEQGFPIDVSGTGWADQLVPHATPSPLPPGSSTFRFPVYTGQGVQILATSCVPAPSVPMAARIAPGAPGSDDDVVVPDPGGVGRRCIRLEGEHPAGGLTGSFHLADSLSTAAYQLRYRIEFTPAGPRRPGGPVLTQPEPPVVAS